MLAKSHRLTTAQFSTHFKTGRRHHTPHLQLIYTATPTFHGAVVVGKKVSKKAVARNRLRRQLYAMLYRETRQVGHTGVFIIIAKPAAATAASTVLRREIKTLINSVV